MSKCECNYCYSGYPHLCETPKGDWGVSKVATKEVVEAQQSINQAMRDALAGGIGITRIDPSKMFKQVSDGSTAGYYELPKGATELQDLISHRNMNAQIGEIFRACYRLGMVFHSPEIRDIKKIIFYATAELERLEKLNAHQREEKGSGTPA